MKKLSILLSALLLVGCSNQNISSTLINENQNTQILSEQKQPLTAKKAYPIALKEAKKLMSSPQLFEVDVWKELNSETIDFGFMQKGTNDSSKFMRIIINLKNNEVTHEEIPDSGKIPNPVNLSYWKLDNEQISKIAQSNGLTDTTSLATLWEDTWHISGLKQDLYFQIDSKTGTIKMTCTDPYLTQCTDNSPNPVKKEISSKFKNKLKLKSKY
ncbi:MAG: hypothetical protein U0354_16720 [Candidatus Sericytochromatia bacterium]